jgi:ankyrin repeat protein
MCYVIVKLVLEYVSVDDLDRGIVIETVENKAKVIKKFTPLQLACARGIFNIVKSLLNKGSSLHISGVFHNRLGLKENIIDMGSPALAICVNPKMQKMHMGNSNFITKFEPEDRDYYLCAKALLEYSANPDINTMIPMYPTPLFLSIQNSKLSKLLLEFGANPNWPNIRGQTPLFILSEKSQDLECFQVLLDFGALIDPPSCRPIFIAISSKNIKAVNFLKENKAEINGSLEVPSALQVAISADDPQMCQQILTWEELKIDWQYRQNGKNMFHRIAVNQGLEVLELLLKDRTFNELEEIKQALNTPSSQDPFQNDTIPLFFALNDLKLSKRFVELGSDVKKLNFVKCFVENNLEKASLIFLLENGCDVHSKHNQKNALWVANEKGRIDLLLLFLKYGADIDSGNSLGQTLLHDACFKGNEAVAKILIQEGANPLKECSRGLNAVDYVRSYYPKKTKTVQDRLSKLIINSKS